MPDFVVHRYGADSSGRGIYATAYMWGVWQQVLAHPDVAPFAHKVVVTQGAFMVRNGGGADASAGYHDAAGTFDLRVWNLLSGEVAALIRTLRAHGCAAWLRNEAHGGFDDPHIHFVLGSDRRLSDGAAYQWRDYLNGGDGMGGRDYHPRPDPLITTPPEDDMADYGERILAAIGRLEERDKSRDKAERERAKAQHEAVLALLDKLADDVKDDATKAQVKRTRLAVETLAAPDPEPEA